MKRFVYVRVSTEAQSYERQDFIIKEYFAKHGIDPSSIDAIVKEKISTRKHLADRQFHNLLAKCEDGDYIYTAGLERIGRTQVEMINLIDYATKKGIYLVTCDDGRILENKTAEGQLYMSIMTALANQERNRISTRTKDTLASYKDQIQKNGYFVKKNGEIKNKLGREKGADLSIAREASIKSKQDKAIAWRENSKGYQLVRTLLGKGIGRMEIIERFNELHELDPENYSTPKGSPLSEFTLSKWANEIGMTLVTGAMVV